MFAFAVILLNLSHELAIILCGQWIGGENERSQAVVKALLGARDAMLAIRYQMRYMGEAAGIPVRSLKLSLFVLCTFVMYHQFQIPQVSLKIEWAIHHRFSSVLVSIFLLLCIHLSYSFILKVLTFTCLIF